MILINRRQPFQISRSPHYAIAINSQPADDDSICGVRDYVNQVGVGRGISLIARVSDLRESCKFERFTLGVSRARVMGFVYAQSSEVRRRVIVARLFYTRTLKWFIGGPPPLVCKVLAVSLLRSVRAWEI